MASARAHDTVIYRLHPIAFLAADPLGAMRAAGRWHSLGTRVVYAAEHISLALLETLLHAGGRAIPPRALTRIMVPAGVATETAAWMEQPASRTFGDAWVREGRSAVLRVPSIAVNRLEHNFVLNPAHPEFKHLKFAAPEPFVFDDRYIVLR